MFTFAKPAGIVFSSLAMAFIFVNININLDESEWKEERPDFNSDEATSFVYNPHRSQSIENQRKRLPIFQNREQVLYLLENHQFLILIGETGSGKSTQVPQVSGALIL